MAEDASPLPDENTLLLGFAVAIGGAVGVAAIVFYKTAARLTGLGGLAILVVVTGAQTHQSAREPYLAVVDERNGQRLLGLISRQDILTAYDRALLREA